MAHIPTPRRRMPLVVLALLLVAALAAGCSSGSPSSASGSAAQSGASPDKAGSGVAAPSSGAGSGSEAVRQVVAAGRQIARTASLSVQVKDIATAAASVRAVTSGLDGYVLSEQMGKEDGPRPLEQTSPGSAFGGYGTISVSVPADKLDSALDQVARIGTVLSRTTSSQDVTDQYVDTQSRVRTMTASLDRVRALLVRAKDIGQVVALESELSRREADLESLEAQLATLKGSVERSTLTVSLSTPAAVATAAADAGFLAGLRSGWHAFETSVTAALTVVGAILPFAVLLALLAWPGLWWLRRRQAQAVTASPAPAAPAAR